VILNFRRSDVAQGEEELSVVVVENLVRDAGAVDAANNLDVGAAVGFRKVAGESPESQRLVVRMGVKLALPGHLQRCQLGDR
jgi:hypothetical protein